MRRVFAYDTKGELMEDATYEVDGTLRSRARMEYEYDGKRNWTKKLVLSWSEERGEFEPSVVYRRAIRYYE